MAIANSITFNGINSLEYNLYISGDKAFNSAEKDYEKVSIPGRNGDFFLFNNRYRNVTRSYSAILFGRQDREYRLLARDIKAWLLSANGYCILEDSYNPDEYCYAQFLGPIDLDTRLLQAAELTLQFDCRPERFLKSGNEVTEVTSSTTIENPTLFTSKPLLKVYGTGNFLMNDISVTINESEDYLYIDSDIESIYKNDILFNNNVTIGDFPVLKPGENIITLNEDITKIDIIPRWYTL